MLPTVMRLGADGVAAVAVVLMESLAVAGDVWVRDWW